MTISEFKDRFLIYLARNRFDLPLILFDKYRSRKFKIPKMDVLKKNYDIDLGKIVILYRISPFKNGKAPIYAKNKLKLTKICLKSFIKGFQKVPLKIIFILDTCPKQYRELIKRLKIKDCEIIDFKKAGNKGTWFVQLEIVKRLKNNNLVYFAEDDYFYLKNSGERIYQALNKIDFVGPCDHLNYYKKPMVNNKENIEVFSNYHFRSSESTCLTFGTSANLIKNNFGLFHKFGTFDHPLWLALKRKGYKLFTPIPSLATHMVKNALAPGIDWQRQWKKYR